MRKFIGILTLAILIAAAIPVPRAAADDKKDPIDTIEDVPRRQRLALFKAQERKSKDDFEGAARVLGDYVKDNDEVHFLVHYNYGNTLLAVDRPEEALVQYRAAVAQEPRFWQGWLNLGETAYNLGHYTDAAEAIMNGYRRSPERNPRLLYFAAAAYLMAEMPEKAEPLLEELVYADRKEPKLDWYRALIMAVIELENADAGHRAVDRMLEVFPSDPEAWKLAFQFAASVHDYRRAAIAMTVKGYLEPLERDEMMMLGSLYTAIELPWTASSYYEEGIKVEAGPEDFERLASVYMAAREPEKALETLERALKKEPTPKLWSLLGDLYYMDEDYGKAYKAYSSCYELDQESGRSLLMMGFCALELGRPEEAAVHLEKAVDFPDYSSNASALLRRAKHLASQGQGG
jgi:cytochrome c-type biogenesis protein CcmH/NrfG